MKAFRFAFLAAFTAIFAVACAGHPTQSAQVKASMSCMQSDPGASDFHIGAGDVLNISVWNNKDLQRTVTVRPDGMISFPLLDDVAAAGLTTRQLQEKVTAGLKQYVTNPQVSVVVQTVNSFTISVLGEVRKPGHYELHSGRVTVLDALAMAGGLTPYASRSRIHVMRDSDAGETRQIHFRYGKAISMNPGNADFCVNPGDIIIVP